MRKRAWIGVGAAAVIAAGLIVVAVVQSTQRSTAEILSATGSAESRELEVVFGPCSMGWEASADETSDTVTVRVLLDGHRGRTCTDEAAIAKVPLDSPLGARRVIDAATGRTVQVDGRS